MAKLGNFSQQPNEALYYTIDYSYWLDTTAGEILDTGTPTIEISPSTSPALVVAPQVTASDQMKMLISGGKNGTLYNVEFRVLTSAGQIKEDELLIRVLDI